MNEQTPIDQAPEDSGLEQETPKNEGSKEMSGIRTDNYKSGIEALLFVSDKPIVIEQFKTVFPELRGAQIIDLIKQLQEEYVNRNSGMVIVDIANGWQMLSNSHAAGYIREFYKTKSKEKLSRPSLESLAIIAYKQPVSRADLEIIRGVNCDGTVAHLLNKGLIEIVGRKEVPGRPFLYGTTKSFLEYFGLRSLEDLPKIESLPQLSQIETIQQADIVPVAEALTNPEAKSQEETQTVSEAGQETSGQARLMQEAIQENTESP
jgi:segregation and condensation protein B